MKQPFKTKENHVEMTNVNRIFIICFWSEQHWLQNETFFIKCL